MHWTPHEIAILREGIARGDNYKTIARSLPGRSLQTVRQRAFSLGLNLRKTRDALGLTSRKRSWISIPRSVYGKIVQAAMAREIPVRQLVIEALNEALK